MRVRVFLFARLREMVGSDSVDLEVPAGSTLEEVWRMLRQQNAALAAFNHPPLMAVNLEYASPETVLSGGEEVAFFPAVSGG